MSSESPTDKKHLVSIICRTLGRPELQEALRSISSQDYPNIEIVLIDAAGQNSLDTTSAGELPLEIVTTGVALSRSQAANAGLEAAHGKYIQFLDDDDWIASNHVSQLVSALENNKEISAAYSSTQKTSATGEPLDYLFKEEFDPILLMRDNYIPIHAILFDSALLEAGCRFDEAFDIYEDWDFWLQLSQHTNFQHIDSITAYYREGGDSATAVEDVRLRYQADNIIGKGRIAIFEKWLPNWTAERVNALIGQLDQSVLLSEKDALIQLEMRKNAEAHHDMEKRDIKIDELNLRANELDLQINEYLRQTDDLNTKLSERDTTISELNSNLLERDRLIGELDTKVSERIQQINELEMQLHENASQLQQLQLHSNRQAAHISELEGSLNAIFASKTWKLMGPIRRAGRILGANENSVSGNSDAEK